MRLPFYPKNKLGDWGIVVGEESSNNLLVIKMVAIGRMMDVRLDYTCRILEAMNSSYS